MKQSRGIGLLGLLILLALAGLLMKAVMSLYQSQMKFEAYSQLQNELLDLRRYIGSTFSCQKTIASLGTCGGGQVIDLRDAQGSIFVKIPNPPSDASGFTGFGSSLIVRASCVTCTDPVCFNGKKVLVEAQRTTSQVDPAGWSDIFAGMTLPCQLP